ncbi:MAG: CPBP family intramembrane metalloprotease [Chloroflexi bacterium]|nr:CPBP family intramembrane metalloprotease [Chloroflexota bacterium]
MPLDRPPSEGAPTEPADARAVSLLGRRGWRILAHVMLFLGIWLVLVAILGLAAQALALFIMIGPDGLTALLAGQGLQVTPATLAELTLPTRPFALLVTAATAFGTVLSVNVMRRFFGGPRLFDLGLHRQGHWFHDSLLGLALGPVMFGTILLLLLAAGWADVRPGTIGPGGLITALATFVFVAFSEEVLARGWLLQVLERGYGRWAGVVGSSVLFALLHASNPGFGLTALIGLFCAGLVLAQAYLVTRRLWLPMAFHLSWNYSEGPIFGFPVSGLSSAGLLVADVHGPDLVTGGSFGPEAGLVVLVGLGLASVVLAFWRRQAAPA